MYSTCDTDELEFEFELELELEMDGREDGYDDDEEDGYDDDEEEDRYDEDDDDDEEDGYDEDNEEEGYDDDGEEDGYDDDEEDGYDDDDEEEDEKVGKDDGPAEILGCGGTLADGGRKPDIRLPHVAQKEIAAGSPGTSWLCFAQRRLGHQRGIFVTPGLGFWMTVAEHPKR